MTTSTSYIQPNELESLIKDEASRTKLVIVDVRDDDFKGGNIKGAINIPMHNFEHDQSIDELIKKVSSAETVVFHCYKSQQRGPFCAKEFTHRLEALSQTTSDIPTLDM